MDGKDPILDNSIINNEMDILERYPGIFFEKMIGEHSYFIEKPVEDKIINFRFFITPSGSVLVSSLIPKDIWAFNGEGPNDIPLLFELDNVVNNIRSLHIHDLVQQLHFNTTSYLLKILPYSHLESTKEMTSFLDTRYKSKVK